MRADAAMLALAARIARHARVAILTNNNLLLRDHLPAICPPLFPLFDDRVFCSAQFRLAKPDRSEEHTSELQSLMRISYAVFCLKKKKTQHHSKSSSHYN